MEAVPRLPMISCDIKISPSNTDFGHTLRKYIRDFYHEDPDSYAKEIKDLETLRQNAIKAPMDFTGCSILKRYYSQLHKLQSRFPMTDDGPACVPFMWTDIYSGVAYNITDIEYEQACILYNIGALHSKLGTVDSRCNAEGMKIACTHFQCAAWAFQHLRDTYPQPKGSDMSHDLLTFFLNIMLAQAQECILEKSMLDSRKSSITAKIAAQVVDYYKCALGIMVSGSPSTDTGSILDIVGSKIFKAWKKFIEFKIAYYGSISHLYMGNQAEEHEKWGERVAWFQSANDHLTEAFKVAKNIDREELTEPLSFTMDVIGGKLNSAKKENEFVYHDKVPALSTLPELKGASLVKGIPFSITDPDVSGPDIFSRLVPMEAHETSSLYSEEKAKLLRSVVSKIESKNEELMAYLSSLQLENVLSFDDEEKIPEELLEKCAAMSVRPLAIADLQDLMKELMEVSKDVDGALKSSFAYLADEERREMKHQEVFGKRSPSLLMMELKKECAKYDEAHKKAIESNNTLETAVNIHINHMSQLLLPLEELATMLPSVNAVKTPENVKAMADFNLLINKVDEMKKQRIFLEQQLRDALMKDDITTDLVTMKKKEDVQQIFVEELKKHSEVIAYLDQNLTAQDNILCALTESNARYAETRKIVTEIKQQRFEMVNALVNSFEAYDDIICKAKKGLEFYKKLQTSVNRLLTRIRGVTKVQEEERAQIAEVRNGPRIAKNPHYPAETHVPKLKDYLPYLSKDGGRGAAQIAPNLLNAYVSHQTQIPPTQVVTEPMRQATLGGPATDFSQNINPLPGECVLPKDSYEPRSIGVRPTPVGSEQPSVPVMCTTVAPSTEVGNFLYSRPSPLPGATSYASSASYNSSQMPYQYANSSAVATSQITSPSLPSNPQNVVYNGGISAPGPNAVNGDSSRKVNYQLPNSIPGAPQSFTSLSTIPSIPSQINNSYTPTVPSNGQPGAASGLNSVPSDYHPRNINYSSNANIGSPYLAQQVITGYVPNSGVMPNFSSSGSYPPQPTTRASLANGQMSYPAASNNFVSVPGMIPSAATSPIPGGYVQQAFPGGSAANTSVSYSANSVGFSSASGVASQYTAASSGHSQYSQLGTAQVAGNVLPTAYPVGAISQGVKLPSAGNPAMSSTGVSNTMPLTGVGASALSRHQSGHSAATNLQTSQPSPILHSGNTVHQSMGQPQIPTWSNSVPAAQYPTYSEYTKQNQSVNSKALPNPNYQAGVPTTQYYQGNVTASLDTKTNTFNSGNQYPLSSAVQAPNPSTYTSSQSGIRTYQTGGNTQIPNYPNSYSNNYDSNVYNANAAMSNSTPNTYGVAFNQANYYPAAPVGGQPQSMTPPTAVNQSSGSMPSQIMNSQLPNVQYPINVSNLSSTNQQNYQLPLNPSTPVNYSAVSVNQPSFPPSQNVSMPTEQKRLSPSFAVQPTLPTVSQEPKSATTLKVQPENSHINAIRDLITPPLETDSVKPSVADSEQTSPPVLQPKVLDLKELSQLKEKDTVHLAKDPLEDPSVRSKFVSEVEKYEKFVEGLMRKSLNGTTPLDQKWKELIDAQDKESRKMSISVARCYPLKNRYPDVMPYDSNRVKLTSAKDDYINASYFKDISSGSPVFVITQTPLPSTYSDFWLMIWEQQVETMICLLSDNELKNHVYFPKERGQTLNCGIFETSLNSCKEKHGFVERMVNITHIKNRMSRVVVHLQFTEWPVSGIPKSPVALLQFISDVLSYQKQQRNLMRPVVVHCSSGVSRSGCFCIITALVNEMSGGHGPRDVAQVVTMASQQRKFLIPDKEHLKFCYDTVLYFAQDLLMKRGILTSRASFDNKLPASGNTTSHVRHPSEDFILGGGGLAKLQSGIENMTVSADENDSKDSAADETSSAPISSNEVVGNGDGAPIPPTVDVASGNTPPDPPEVEHNENGDANSSNKTEELKTVPSITSLLDPSNFTLDSAGSPGKRKITKENFASSKGSLSTSSSDSADPLSQLDPLWSLKK